MAQPGIFWDSVAQPSQASFSSSEFFYTGSATPITRAEISKTIMKKALTEPIFRKYTGKVADFRENQSSYFIMPKKMTYDYSQVWQGQLGEFQPLPIGSLSYAQTDIQVDERGLQFPFTERVRLFANYDIEAEIKEQAGNSIIGSIEHDLVVNAFAYLDVLGVAQGGNPVVYTGQSLLPSATFGVNTNPISITQCKYSSSSPYNTINSTTIETLTMNDVLYFSEALEAFYTPSYQGSGFGNYLVIVNRQAQNRLMNDPIFYNAVTRFQDRERLYAGYIGSFYGQEFVLDVGKWIDTYICTVNPTLQGRAICIFLSKDAVREAIVKPEQVLPMQEADFGRYMAYAIHTYRGERPMWFSSEGQAGGGILVGA